MGNSRKNYWELLGNYWPMPNREPSQLLVDGQVLWSEEGTTQGDPLAMPLYALATIPLINRLSSVPDVKQVWYADDASAAGRLSSLRSWWDTLQSTSPASGIM